MKDKAGMKSIIPLASIIIVMISFVLIGGQHFAAQQKGKEPDMNEYEQTVHKDIAPIDLNIPERIETATFALG